MPESSKPRILHCPIVALYQPFLYVKGLRELGYHADYMAFNFMQDAWLARACDFDLEIDCQKGLLIEKSREIDFFLYAIDNYDIFHFHSGFGLFHPSYSLWSRLAELKFLKRIGKKIVMSWWGCDLRSEEIDSKYNHSACDFCTIKEEYCRSTDKREMTKKVFSLADVHLSNGDLLPSFKEIKWIDNAIDCDEWHPLSDDEIPDEFRLKKTAGTMVYHSFGNRSLRGDIKGTSQIFDSIERLKREGYSVDFIFLEKVPNTALKYYQAQADIVIDQLRCGWYGSTGMECLAMGKPIITYIRPEVEKIVPHEHPLVNANVDNIYDVLKDLLNNPYKIKVIGSKSREYSIKYHHYKIIAKQLELIYEDLFSSRQ